MFGVHYGAQGRMEWGDAELVVTFNEFWLKCLVESIMMHER